MKILQVVPYFYPAWSYGGPGKLVMDTSSYFSSQGHAVTVYTSDSYDRCTRMPLNKKIKKTKHMTVRYFRNISNTGAFRHHIFIAPMMFICILRDITSFDMVHLHDFYILANVWIALLCRIFHKPYVLSVHGCLEEKRMEDKSAWKRLFLRLFGVPMLQHASALIATSLNEKKAYLSYRIPENNIYMIGHGIRIQEFVTSQAKHVCRDAYRLKNTSFVISYVGRIHKIKGLDLLIRAISLLKSSRIQVVIAGSDDGHLSYVKQLISNLVLDNIIQTYGPCFGEKKAQLFKASDLFVYPSHSEGFSLGILEAAGAGLPLLITKGCHFDKVKTSNAGLVVESSPKTLAKAVQLFIRDKRRRTIMGRNARRMIEKEYAMDAISDRILRLYDYCRNHEK